MCVCVCVCVCVCKYKNVHIYYVQVYTVYIPCIDIFGYIMHTCTQRGPKVLELIFKKLYKPTYNSYTVEDKQTKLGV